MSNQNVVMYELSTKTNGMVVEVTFRRYHGDTQRTLTCRHQDILSQHPLQVLVTVPPGAHILDMHKFEGRDVILELAPQAVSPLVNGE